MLEVKGLIYSVQSVADNASEILVEDIKNSNGESVQHSGIYLIWNIFVRRVMRIMYSKLHSGVAYAASHYRLSRCGKDKCSNEKLRIF